MLTPLGTKIQHLTTIRDARQAILGLQTVIFERTRQLSEGGQRAVSQEEVELAMITVHEARIALAQAELDLFVVAQPTLV